MKDILVFIEVRAEKIEKGSLELVTKARELASKLNSKVVGLVVGDFSDSLVQKITESGLDELVVANSSVFKHYKVLEYTKVLTDLVKERQFDIVLISATTIGRDLAPRCSARLNTGLTADCTELEIDEKTGNLLATRPSFGGNLIATIICEKHRPQMATTRSGVLPFIPEKRECLITKLDSSNFIEDNRVIVEDFVSEKKEQVDLTKQNIIIAGGRGVKTKKDFDLLFEIAGLLGGEVGATRPVVEDNFVTKDRQIGQTGINVSPNLYIACGISGAIQHMSGVQKARYIVAINQDKTAPIFNYASLGIVGDYKEILLQLKEALLSQNKAN